MVAPVYFHLLIDPLGRAAQREFAKRDQIAFGKEILNRMLDLFRDVYLPVFEPLKKIVRLLSASASLSTKKLTGSA